IEAVRRLLLRPCRQEKPRRERKEEDQRREHPLAAHVHWDGRSLPGSLLPFEKRRLAYRTRGTEYPEARSSKHSRPTPTWMARTVIDSTGRTGVRECRNRLDHETAWVHRSLRSPGSGRPP